MKVLIACDIQEPSGGHPEWHILGDALTAIQGGQVTTMDGQTHDIGRWDLIIHTEPYDNERGYKGEAVCVEPYDYCSCGEREENMK